MKGTAMFATVTKFLPARGAVVLLLAAGAAGCEGGSVPPQANPDKARAALARALDAWKNGEPIDALARGAEPIYFNDPKCRSDARLVGYEMADAHEFHGQSVRIPVVLSVKFPDGTTKEHPTSYLIDTSPAIVIVP